MHPRAIFDAQTQALLQIDIINYARAVANPLLPVTINTTVINPSSTNHAGVVLKQVYSPLVLRASLMVGITFIPILLLEEKDEKTLRMLRITPASFVNNLVGRLNELNLVEAG